MFNPDTHWHYLSNQTPDEVVFMKMFDSDRKVQASCESDLLNLTMYLTNYSKVVHTPHLRFQVLQDERTYCQERALKSE
jgi:hypothetical protein